MTMQYSLSALEVRKRQLAEVHGYAKHRIRYLPIQIANLERKLQALYREAERRGLDCRDVQEPVQ